ncbi:hypothetical protein ACHAW6_009534, partial [Cyclotella cf. meneghiniana]
MKVFTLLRYLVAGITISTAHGQCGWQYFNASCNSGQCCNLYASCGTGSNYCAPDKCQSGNCVLNTSISEYNYCSDKFPNGTLENLDLSVSSPYRPTIDGIISKESAHLYTWEGFEYDDFTVLDMYVAGNPTKPVVAAAYIAYDCENNILCLAAHLLNASIAIAEFDHIVQDTASAWIRFGPDTSAPQLHILDPDPNGSNTSYIFKPDFSSQAIGYEGCWDFNEYRFKNIAPVANDYLHIHMDSEDKYDSTKRNTVSTGMQNYKVCLSQDCRTSRPTRSPTNPPTSPPTKSPTNPPSKSPTNPPTTSPSSSPSKSPSASPTTSPTSSPTASPTKTPTASPTTSPSSSPSK